MKQDDGFSLIELLVSMVIMSVMMMSIMKVFLIQNRTYAQQDLIAGRDENLRLATDAVTTALRQARYGAPEPSSLLPTWIPWASDFSSQTAPPFSNPKITLGGTSTTPDSVSVAACFEKPVATISTGGAAAAGTTLSLTPTTNGASLTTLLDTNTRRLILIGDSEFAQVKSVGSTSITIDTNPATTTTNEGLSRAYPAGTPICRVDVTTYSINASSQLVRDDNQGAGQQVVAEGIRNLKISGTDPYTVSLTAQTEWRDPMTGSQDRLSEQDVVDPVS